MVCERRPELAESCNVIEGHYDEIKDWIMDPKGYFLIRINPETNQVELGHCIKDNVVEAVITGEKPQDLYFAAIEAGLVERLDHAAYLGKELQKAFDAKRNNEEYVQN